MKRVPRQGCIQHPMTAALPGHQQRTALQVVAVTHSSPTPATTHRCPSPTPSPGDFPHTNPQSPSQIVVPAGSACDHGFGTRAILLQREGKKQSLPRATKSPCLRCGRHHSTVVAPPRQPGTVPAPTASRPSSLCHATGVDSPSKLTCHPKAGPTPPPPPASQLYRQSYAFVSTHQKLGI